MWDVAFDESMLDKNIIIHCPDKSLASELMEILERNGIKWGFSESPTSHSWWVDYMEETCYWVESKSLAYGDIRTAMDDEYISYFKCTFFGTESQNFETATNDELMAFLGIGGV